MTQCDSTCGVHQPSTRGPTNSRKTELAHEKEAQADAGLLKGDFPLWIRLLSHRLTLGKGCQACETGYRLLRPGRLCESGLDHEPSSLLWSRSARLSIYFGGSFAAASSISIGVWDWRQSRLWTHESDKLLGPPSRVFRENRLSSTRL